MRCAVGAGFPVFIKMSAHDGWPGGVQPDEPLRWAAELDRLRINPRWSAGTPEAYPSNGWGHLCCAHPRGQVLRLRVDHQGPRGSPVISVEGWRDPRRIAEALERIDAVPVRLVVREHHLAAMAGRRPTPAKCVSLNKCLDLMGSSGWAASSTRGRGARPSRIHDPRSVCDDDWCPQRNSNPCRRLERSLLHASSAVRSWGSEPENAPWTWPPGRLLPNWG